MNLKILGISVIAFLSLTAVSSFAVDEVCYSSWGTIERGSSAYGNEGGLRGYVEGLAHQQAHDTCGGKVEEKVPNTQCWTSGKYASCITDLAYRCVIPCPQPNTTPFDSNP